MRYEILDCYLYRNVDEFLFFKKYFFIPYVKLNSPVLFGQFKILLKSVDKLHFWRNYPKEILEQGSSSFGLFRVLFKRVRKTTFLRQNLPKEIPNIGQEKAELNRD